MFGISAYFDGIYGGKPMVDVLDLDGFDYIELVLSGESDPTGSLKAFETLSAKKKIKVVHLPEIDVKNVGKTIVFINLFMEKNVDIFNLHLLTTKMHATLDQRISALKLLRDITASSNAKITVENTEEDPENFKQLFSRIEDFDFCLDVGHGNLSDDKKRNEKFIDEHSSRLRLVHLHDNNGGKGEQADLHLPLGEGNIDFQSIFLKLKDVGYLGPMTLELYKAECSKWRDSLSFAKRLVGEHDI